VVYVRLEREWTDGGGRTHTAGDMVDVDAATLATLEASGVVAEPEEPDAGSTPDGPWPGPTSDPDGPWPGPTSDPDTGDPQPDAS
jgi:hypothetical protein